MNPARLASLLRYGVAFDLESHLVQPGLVAPPPVCGSVAQYSPDAQRIQGVLLDKDGALDALIKMLDDDRIVIVGQNIAFDFLVMAVYAATSRRLDLMPRIFKAYRDDRVFDIGVAEQLHAIARGTLRMDPRTGMDLRDPLEPKDTKVGYRLSVLVDLVLNRVDAKINAAFRKSYALLEAIPMAWWPVDARQYPVDDTCNTLEVALAQAGFLPSISVHEWFGGRCRRCRVIYADMPKTPATALCQTTAPRLNLHEVSAQTYTAWAMHLGAAWGFLVDAVSVMDLEAKTLLVDENGELTDRGREMQRFVDAKILRKDGTEDQGFLKRLTAESYGCVGKHEACGGTGKVVTRYAKRNSECPHGAELKAQGKATGDCPVCPRKILATKQCVECSATGMDLQTAPLPMTEASDTYPNGQVQTSRDALGESGNELLMDYARFLEDKKLGTTYLKWLKNGFDEQGRQIPLTLRPNVLLETGRTSYGAVVQQLPRKGGVRDCLIPRRGRVFSTVDYEAGELITHAQSCLRLVGFSRLAEALLRNLKPHNALAATILSVGYDEFERRYKANDRQASDTRQAAKPANFGFPGRMGAVKLVQQQRKQGPDTPHPSGPTWVTLEDETRVRGYKGLRFCLLMNANARACGEPKVTEWNGRTISPTCRACILAAAELRKGWLKQWPENTPYFEHIKAVDEAGGLIEQHVSKRLRTPSPKEAGAGNSLANGYFQGLLADAAKSALRRISFECYVAERVSGDLAMEKSRRSEFAGSLSPLYGSRVVVFQHDEVITEHDEVIAHEAAHRVSEVMVEELQIYCPDLAEAVRAEPALMGAWFKDAKKVVNNNGRLVAWEPKRKSVA